MALSIKSKEAYRLARELSQLTGETLTEAVTTSLRERLERVYKDSALHDDEVERLLAQA